MVPEIDVTQIEPRRAAGAVMIDVRQPEEYEAAHVPGAVLIPLGEVRDRLAEIPTTGEVLVICRTGSRSRQACELLRANNVDAVNVAGGTLAWIEARRPVVQGLDPA